MKWIDYSVRENQTSDPFNPGFAVYNYCEHGYVGPAPLPSILPQEDLMRLVESANGRQTVV